MVSRSLASALLMLAALYASGCQPDCRLVCERIEEADCEGYADVLDCEKSCKHDEDLVTNAECQEEYDEYLLCIDDLEDICDFVPDCDVGETCSDPKCDNEIENLAECVQDYCIEHPRNNECEARIAPVAE
jgi:hypothetical protein